MPPTGCESKSDAKHRTLLSPLNRDREYLRKGGRSGVKVLLEPRPEESSVFSPPFRVIRAVFFTRGESRDRPTNVAIAMIDNNLSRNVFMMQFERKLW